jgi:hypothetical protein
MEALEMELDRAIAEQNRRAAILRAAGYDVTKGEGRLVVRKGAE